MLFQRLRFVVPVAFILSTIAHSQETARPAKATPSARSGLNVGRVMHITYGSPSWNTDSTKVDSAYLIMKDVSSGKIVQIQLEETEPDSSKFSGQFSVNVSEQDKIMPEIYIPPAELRGTDKDNKKLYELIKSNKLPRKPLIWKRNAKGQSILDVYDTREQAEAAMKVYGDEQKLAQDMKKKQPNKLLTNQTALAAAQALERKAELDKLAMDAVKNAADRVRMEQIERQKAEDRAKAAQQATEAERQRNIEKAAKLYAEGNAFYTQGNFPPAESKFKQAVDLDPANKDYYYKYGVTLYRNQKYNEALVALKIAKVDPSQEVERNYYTGLVYYRLAELENSLAAFDKVAKSNDKTMGPSAVFYQGVIQFAQEKYDTSKTAFEKVIDTSDDARLDDQAEDYLERIAGAMAFQKMRENKWTLTAVVGLMFDSNVLLAPDNSAASATATNISDVRLLTLADLQFRPIFNEVHELAPHVTVNLMNSAKNASAPADPYLYDLAIPYSYKGKAFGSGYKLTVTPGYEMLYMDPNGTGTKAQELSAYFLAADNTFVMSKDWISLYTLEYRQEKSFDPSSNGPDDLSGTKYTLRTVQTFFLDKGRKTAVMPTVGYIRDSAKGSNKSYNRYDLGATYVRPSIWDSSLNLGLNYYQMTYPGTDPKRVDSDVNFTVGLSKPVREWVIWGVSGTYTKNSSTDRPSEYTKYVVLTTATFLTNF